MDIALKDIKVIEYGEFICAPYCGKMLADLGADVIKVEKPDTGDSARRSGPFLDNIPGLERSGFFQYLNNNKRGVTLNLNTATGRELFKKLIADADILVEDSKPGTMEELRLSYEILSKINPRLVMVSVTPFGQTGPYSRYKGCDLITVEMSGIGYITPRWIGTANQEPLRVTQVYSYITGITAAIASMTALYVQRKIGKGQHVDISQLEALIIALNYDAVYWPYQHKNITRASRPEYAPIHFIKCKDGWVQVSIVTDEQWSNFVELLGNPSWAKEPLFQERFSRGEHWESLEPLINDCTINYTKDELFHMAKKQRVPLAPAYTVSEVMALDQLNTRDFFTEIEHPETGRTLHPGAPYKMQETPWQVSRPAPRLGEHNYEVFCGQLGYTKDEFVKLYESRII